MASKPPTDTFTRFTSSQPHAMARPTAFSSKNPSPSSASKTSPKFTSSNLTSDPRAPPASAFQAGPEGETPLQKVARLRAAARLAKSQQAASPVDRFLIRGRRWADNVHRFTTYALIAFTGVSAVVAVYGVTSLIAHNRRQKRAWIEREMDRLHEAQQAFLRGEASAEQLHLLEQERAGEEMALAHKREKDLKKEQGYWSRLKGLVSAQTAKGEMGSETTEEKQSREARQARATLVQQLGSSEGFIEGEVGVKTVPVAAVPSGIKGVGVDSKGRPVPENRVEYVTNKVEGERRKGEKAVEEVAGIKAGPLDVLAGNAAEAASSEGRGWMSWLRGGKS